MEVGTLQHHVLSGLVRTATLSSEDSSDTHWLLGVADGKIVLAQRMLLTIEGNKLLTLVLVFHDDMMTCHHVSIEAMERLSVCHHDVVGDVYDIIDWTQTYNTELILQPIWRFLYFTVSYRHTSIALTCVSILNSHINWEIVIVHREGVIRRAMEVRLLTVGTQPCIQISCHTIVRECVRTIGSDINFYQPIALQVIILSCRLTYRCILWQYYDTFVRCADTNLVLSTNHSVRLHTT